MYEYFVEAPKIVELKKQIESYSGIAQGRLKRLFDILGDVTISKEFIDAYLSYFDYTSSKRGNLSLTEESLIGMYELSRAYPQLESRSIKLIMGEYVKDLFDELHPLQYFDGMTLREMDDSFEKFMRLLKQAGEKSDIPYREEEAKITSSLIGYGSGFVDYIKKYAVKYHKTFEDIYYAIPDASVVRKDADIFYEIGRKELFGPTGYPYSYRMCEFMILFGDVDDFQHPLMYDSSIRGRFESPMTTAEFLKSIEERRKEVKVRKK